MRIVDSQRMALLTVLVHCARYSKAFVPLRRSASSSTTSSATTAGLRRPREAKSGDSASTLVQKLQQNGDNSLHNFRYGAFLLQQSSSSAATAGATETTSDDILTFPLADKQNSGGIGNTAPRMRFAPSPTGSLHVGGARTALYNWLVARKGLLEEPQSDAAFILRVEDTDVARSTKESEDSVLGDLTWLGLNWNEGPDMDDAPYGPYRQSERSDLYFKAAQQLLASGKAYRCFCSEEELAEMKAEQEARGEVFQYDGRWRDASEEAVQAAMDEGKPHVVRFKVPGNNARVVIDDVVRGTIGWEAQATVGDFILLRSSGVPVYNFCVAVDDASMGITTVVRAEEHLTNTVRQALVLDALGAPRPRYAHCSLILGEDKQKLSKRHGATSCDQYRLDGFLPDAMINYLALLGWNDGTDNEIFTRDDLIDAFELKRVVKSPSVFDIEKLKWVNSQHLKMMSVDEILALVEEQMEWCGVLNAGSADNKAAADFTFAATATAKQMMETTKDAATNAEAVLGYHLPESFEKTKGAARRMIENGNFYGIASKIIEEYEADTFPLPDKANPLAAFQDEKGNLIEEDSQSGPGCEFTVAYKAHMKALAKEMNVKGKHLFHPIRLALTGEMSGQDVTKQLSLLELAAKEGSVVNQEKVVPIAARMERLRQFCDTIPEEFRAPKNDEKKDTAQSTEAKVNGSSEPVAAVAADGASAADPKDSYEGPPIQALDIRVGRVTKVWEHEEADKLYCEEIDVGEDEPRLVASGLKPYLKPEDIDGRKVLVLCNLKARKLVGFPSHGMVLCASNADHSDVQLVNPPIDAKIGERVTIPDFDFEGEEGSPFAENKLGKKKVFEKLAPFLKTNKYGVPEFLDRPFMTSAGVCTSSIKDGSVS